MLNFLEFLNKNLDELLSVNPKLIEFLDTNWFKYDKKSNLRLIGFLNGLGENFYLDNATTKEILSKSFYDFYVSIIKQENQNNLLDVKEITIKSWKNKSWIQENFSTLTIKRGEIISIVWPTWSWKSRLLADIEWMASEDTPTNRTILVNWTLPSKLLRYSSEYKLVA